MLPGINIVIFYFGDILSNASINSATTQLQINIVLTAWTRRCDGLLLVRRQARTQMAVLFISGWTNRGALPSWSSDKAVWIRTPASISEIGRTKHVVLLRLPVVVPNGTKNMSSSQVVFDRTADLLILPY